MLRVAICKACHLGGSSPRDSTVAGQSARVPISSGDREGRLSCMGCSRCLYHGSQANYLNNGIEMLTYRIRASLTTGEGPILEYALVYRPLCIQWVAVSKSPTNQGPSRVVSLDPDLSTSASRSVVYKTIQDLYSHYFFRLLLQLYVQTTFLLRRPAVATCTSSRLEPLAQPPTASVWGCYTHNAVSRSSRYPIA
jgi:hypothetical protein